MRINGPKVGADESGCEFRGGRHPEIAAHDAVAAKARIKAAIRQEAKDHSVAGMEVARSHLRAGDQDSLRRGGAKDDHAAPAVNVDVFEAKIKTFDALHGDGPTGAEPRIGFAIRLETNERISAGNYNAAPGKGGDLNRAAGPGPCRSRLDDDSSVAAEAWIELVSARPGRQSHNHSTKKDSQPDGSLRSIPLKDR